MPNGYPPEYAEYIKAPDDIGKRIADNIKKCTDTTPTGISNYIDYPLDF